MQVHGGASATVAVTDERSQRHHRRGRRDGGRERGAAAFALTRTRDLGEALAVTMTKHAIDLDPVTSRQRTVIFRAESPAAALTVNYWDDYADEDDGSITVTIGDGDGYEVGDPGAATVTVTDNDPSPTLLLGAVRHAESAGVLELEVGLSFAQGVCTTSRTVTAAYATADGTATAGDDYTAASGTLTFVPTQENLWQQPPQTIRVPVHDNEVHERDETFTLTVSDVAHAGPATLSAKVTIVNDDLPVVRLESLTAAGNHRRSTHSLAPAARR